MSNLDNILLSTLRYDVPLIINQCCQQFSNWWLPVHLTDLLQATGVYSPNEEKDDSVSFRESLIVTYAETLSKHKYYWQVVAYYLANSGGDNADIYLKHFVERIPINCEKKAAKVLRLCQQYELLSEERSIYRQLAMRSLQVGRLGNALSLSIKSKDPELSKFITDKVLHNFTVTGKFSNTDVIDDFGSSVLLSDRLSFLSKYRDFQKLHADGNVQEAACLLLNLLVSQTAPETFQLPLMIDSMSLLEEEKPVYGVDETSTLLAQLNRLAETRKVTTFTLLTWTEFSKLSSVNLFKL